MNIGVAGSMQFTERMMELCEQLEAMGHLAFMSKFGPYFFVGKTDEEKEKIKLPYRFLEHLLVSAWNRLKYELLRWHETFEVSPQPSLAQ